MSRCQAIEWWLREGIGVLTTNRPDKRNALDVTMREETADVVRRMQPLRYDWGRMQREDLA